MRERFNEAIKKTQAAFDQQLADAAISRLADYYDLVQEHNPLLHLVAPCSPEEFATRHVLESLTLLKHLPNGARLADVGAGAGLPSVPCLLARDDLRATLIESKEKKTKFLDAAITKLGLGARARVINRQFEEARAGESEFVTCRALDKFTAKLPQLMRWAGDRTVLLFGGESLREELERHQLAFTQELMPLSEKRFLFVVTAQRR